MLSQEEILKIAKLAKISLSDEEVLKYQNQLSSVLDYADQISEIQTTDNIDLAKQEKNRAVKDEAKPCMEREKLLKNAPKQKNGFFVVPKVIKK